MWFYVRWRYHIVHYLVQYLCVKDKECSKQFHQNKKRKKWLNKPRQGFISHQSAPEAAKLLLRKWNLQQTQDWRWIKKLYIPVKWIHILSFVSLLFLADLGNIWKKIFSRRRCTSLRIRLKSGGACLWKKLFLLPYCCFCISRHLFTMKMFFTYLHFNPWNTKVNPFVPTGAQSGLNCHHLLLLTDSSLSLT